MPATKLSRRVAAERQDERVLVGVLRKYLSINEKTVVEVAEDSGMSGKTLYSRMKSADDFTVGELCRVRSAAGIPKDELLKALEVLL